jgi:hypothetical protein
MDAELIKTQIPADVEKISLQTIKQMVNHKG